MYYLNRLLAIYYRVKGFRCEISPNVKHIVTDLWCYWLRRNLNVQFFKIFNLYFHETGIRITSKQNIFKIIFGTFHFTHLILIKLSFYHFKLQILRQKIFHHFRISIKTSKNTNIRYNPKWFVHYLRRSHVMTSINIFKK